MNSSTISRMVGWTTFTCHFRVCSTPSRLRIPAARLLQNSSSSAWEAESVIAAGRIRKPEQAETALELGLSLVAVGQGLVMNPEWVDLAQNEKADEIDTALDPNELSKIVLPA